MISGNFPNEAIAIAKRERALGRRALALELAKRPPSELLELSQQQWERLGEDGRAVFLNQFARAPAVAAPRTGSPPTRGSKRKTADCMDQRSEQIVRLAQLIERIPPVVRGIALSVPLGLSISLIIALSNKH